MTVRSAEFEAWADRARALSVEETCLNRYPDLKIRRSSEGYEGECPRCGGEDRFGINRKKNVWNCRHCQKGGDAIALVENAEGLTFIQAVEVLTGEPPPGRERQAPRDMEEDPAAKERRERERQKQIEKERRARQERAAKTEQAAELWEAGEPIKGTAALKYLRQRSIDVRQWMIEDLRFHPSLEYLGFPDDQAKEQVPLGRFPAMLAAIRDAAGNLIGVHRTYIDPRTNDKAKLPGRRNAAKKVLGQQQGGHIRLGPKSDVVAMGEGIETTLSWYLMGYESIPENCSLMASVNLGNMAGKALGRRRHPSLLDKFIPDSDPDPEHPGVVLPDYVKHIILLGDADGDQPFTAATVLTAMERFLAQGREVTVWWADQGDFNSMLVRKLEGEHAA